MTVPDGSLAGRKVIVLEPIQCFRFLDLPAELRNNIYELLFPEQSPMRKSGKNIRLYHSRPGFKTTSRNRERDNKNDILRVSMRPPSNLVANVLSVCRQVLHEAAPIAYASSTFCGELGPLNAFLLAAGGMCDSLQHLEVLPGAKLEASSVWSGIGTTLTRLASSRMLRNITIPHRAVCACRDKLRFGEPFRVPYYLDRHVRGFCQGKTASGANAALSCIRVLTETCCNCSASNNHRRPCVASDASVFPNFDCGEAMRKHCIELESKTMAELRAAFGK